MNRLLLFIFFWGVGNLSCAQDKQEYKSYTIENYLDEESKHINKENYVEEIMKRIKHYPEEPIYYLRINKQNCLIEVLINDFVRLNDYELSNYVTPLQIGGLILKSGTQTVTVRMYPVEDLINQSLGKEGSSIDTILPNSSVAISVIKIDNKSEKKLKDEVVITENISPTADGKFVGSGLPYYEYSFTFQAEVPYELEGWTKGQDLRKLDQKKLGQKALEFYKMVQQIYVDKDLDSWLKLNFRNNYRIYSTLYCNINVVNEEFRLTKKKFTFDFNTIPISPYTMSFEGNGKLLHLLQTNPDPFYRGEIAACIEYINEDGDLATIFPGITLYLPEGRSLDDGLMMWK